MYIKYPQVGSGTTTFPSLAPNGFTSAPSYANSTGKTGMYFGPGEVIDWSTNQTNIGSVSATGAWVIGASGGVADHTVNGNTLTLQSSNSGGVDSFSVLNSSNTGASNALVQARVGGTSAGFAFFEASVLAGSSWAWGIVASSGDFRMNPATGITGAPTFGITQAGAFTIGASGGTPQHSLNTATATNASGVGTLTNLPSGVSGNPAGYIQININGTQHYIPYF